MTALDAIDKRAIYFIEGAGQSGFVTAWGDGFVTNDAIISQNGLSDPKPFFDRLSTMPFLDRVSPKVSCADGCAVWEASRCLWQNVQGMLWHSMAGRLLPALSRICET